MPNKTGGKNYKKTKHSSERPIFIEKQEDQQYARIIQVLGNRNVLAFCNDNKIRLCHIRGSIRKDTWINNGDIVLVSLRDFLKQNDNEDTYEKGDVLYKYDRDLYSRLKKDDHINVKIFLTLETMGIDNIKKLQGAKIEIEEDYFDKASCSEDESEESIDVDNI